VRELIHDALRLISDLHELARAETGKVALYREVVVLQDLLRASIEEFRAVATKRGLSLLLESPDETVILETDVLRVRQILSNLVTNAIKYTDTGSVVVRLRSSQGDAGRWAEIEVVDTGRGIPEDQLSLLFEEFVRLGAPDRSGAGLGLAISQRLAEILGGRISVQSAPGRGSQFTLWLPVATSATSASPALMDDRAHDPADTHAQDSPR
jgi:protein-histidine pros-kinase